MALEGGEGSASRPGRSLRRGMTRYPLYRRLGGPQGRSGPVRKISPPPGFDPRPARSPVAISTELPGPHLQYSTEIIHVTSKVTTEHVHKSCLWKVSSKRPAIIRQHIGNSLALVPLFHGGNILVKSLTRMMRKILPLPGFDTGTVQPG